jgi:hypothetical protein
MSVSSSTSPVAPNVRAAIRLDFRPEVGLISRTSRFVRDFFGNVLADPDATSRVMLTTYELLENVAKHSVDGYGHFRVELVERGRDNFVRVHSRNRAQPDKLERLRRMVDELASAGDTSGLYQKMIAASAGGGVADPEEGVGIGLARVRSEAEMLVSYSVEADEVAICAETPVVLKAARR